MKGRIFALVIALLFIAPFNALSVDEKDSGKETNNFSFAVDSSGYGYSFPPGLVFIVGPQIITWSYENGTTKSFSPPFYVNGSQFGIAIALFGVWKSPNLLNQPGNVSGMVVGIILVFPT